MARAFQRVPNPPSSVTGPLGVWLAEVAKAVNDTPTMSYFSGTTPESVLTASAGHLAVNMVSGTTAVRAYIKGGDPADGPTTTGWTGLTPGSVAAGYVTSVSGTASRITVTGTVTPTVDIASDYVGQATITTIGTLTTGAVPASLVTAGTFPGAYSFTGLITASAGATIASGQTLTLTGGTVAGAPTWSSSQAITLSTAAQPNVTSLGTLTALQVDNLNVNGNTISSTSGAINITPLAGQAIVLDGTINVDAGVVTGATSITSTSFVGALTGNASTATALETARTIGGVSFDGTANITVSTATSGFTVSGGTLAVSDQITSTKATGGVFVDNAADASAARYFQLANGSSTARWGIESSTGGSLVTGSAADSTFFGASSNTPTELYTNNTVRLSISNAGAFDFKSNALSGVTTLAGTGAISGFTTFTSTGLMQVGPGGTGTTAAAFTLHGSSGSGGGAIIRLNKNGTEKVYIGTDSAINGGTSDDLDLYGVSGVSVRIYTNAALNVTFGAATAVFNSTALSGITTLATSGTITTTGAGNIQGLLVAGNASTNAAYISFKGGSTTYWHTGLNVAASNQRYDIYDAVNAALAMSITGGANPAVAFNGALSGITTLAGSGAVSGFTSAAFSGKVSTTSGSGFEVEASTADVYLRATGTGTAVVRLFKNTSTELWNVGKLSGADTWSVYDVVNTASALTVTAGSPSTVTIAGLISAAGLPTSAGAAGTLWVDTGAGNVVKRA